MIYNNLPEYSNEEINLILNSCDYDKIKQVLLSIGEYSLDYNFALNLILEKFLSSNNDEIRSYCALGFSYLARRFKQMDVNVINLLKDEVSNNATWRGRVQDAIDDIEVFVK